MPKKHFRQLNNWCLKPAKLRKLGLNPARLKINFFQKNYNTIEDAYASWNVSLLIN